MPVELSYNEVLYRKRKQYGMSKRKFAKFLGIPPLFYGYFENGYVKPGKKYIKLISEKLGIDYQHYFTGISSYPVDLDTGMRPFERWYKSLLSKLWVKIVFVILLLSSIFTTAFSFYKYNDTMNHAEKFYTEKYLEFTSAVKENGTTTFSLFHEFTRPEIHLSEEDRFISISTSKETYALRDLNCYIHYKEDNLALYYIVPNLAQASLEYISVQYIDYTSFTKLISKFYIKDNGFVFSDEIYYEDNIALQQDDPIYSIVKEKMASHLSTINLDFTRLIKEKTGMDYDFYSELLVDHKKGAVDNLFSEIIFLALGILGIGLNGLFLFAILFAIFFGLKENEEKRKRILTADLEYHLVYKVPEIKEEPVKRKKNGKVIKREIKDDIRFFPFIPETVLEIVGICLILLGSIRIFLNVYSLFFSDGINQEFYNQTSSNLFKMFTVGMFLLYFIDFDIFLEDRRNLRNFFLYGLVFFGLYFIECILLDYLSKTRGLVNIVSAYYVIPNNFGTISCYFGIMFFLFYEPKWLNSNKKRVFFRILSILPIAWIFTSSLIFLNYKNWGWELNNWQLYFFDSERPQFSFLCVSYLLGLYFIRSFYKKKYGQEKAKRLFNGNRFYFLKNLFVCILVAIIAIGEYCLRNTSTNIKGIGSYYQIVYLIPCLLFYHPHIGKRCKPLDYFTLGLYAIFFCIGYVLAFMVLIVVLLT